MGGAPSTPRLGGGAPLHETAEYLIAAFVGEKSFPLASDYWHKLLELPLDLRWPSDRVHEACHLFGLCIVIFLGYCFANQASLDFLLQFILFNSC